jgi:hypothetical protein
MNVAFQLGTHASRKNHSQHVVQVFENKIDTLLAFPRQISRGPIEARKNKWKDAQIQFSATDQSRPH